MRPTLIPPDRTEWERFSDGGLFWTDGRPSSGTASSRTVKSRWEPWLPTGQRLVQADLDSSAVAGLRLTDSAQMPPMEFSVRFAGEPVASSLELCLSEPDRG
jgi:hypothetical protein